MFGYDNNNDNNDKDHLERFQKVHEEMGLQIADAVKSESAEMLRKLDEFGRRKGNLDNEDLDQFMRDQGMLTAIKDCMVTLVFLTSFWHRVDGMGQLVRVTDDSGRDPLEWLEGQVEFCLNYLTTILIMQYVNSTNPVTGDSNDVDLGVER